MKKMGFILLSIAFAASLTACGKKDSAAVSQDSDGSHTENSSVDTGADGQSGSDIKVVATSVAIVEILDALGVEAAGVPTSGYELPKSAEGAVKVGNPMSPDMEVIKSLNPGIVFSVSSLEPALKDGFDAVNIPSAFMDLNSFDGLIDSIKLIGEKTNRKEKAYELAEEIQERAKEISENAADKDAGTVLIIFGASGNFQVATEESYVGDLVKRVGGRNIVEGAEGSFLPVDIEFLASKNPDYILLMTHANPEESRAAFEKEFSENGVWDNFDAVKNNKVIALDSKYFGMSANLLVTDAMENLEEILYGNE